MTELAVAMSLMGVVAAMYLASVISIQGSVIRQEYRSQGNDSIRLALAQLDREIRSGNVVYDPAVEPVPSGHEGYALRIQTQANGSTRTPPVQCIRWRIKETTLQRESFHVVGGVAQVLSPWRTIADGIANKTLGVLPFSLSSDGRLVNILLLANPKPSSPKSTTIRAETSIGVRNSTTAVDPCSPVPPWN